MNEAVIVSAARTAVGRATKGSLRTTRPDDLAATVIRAVVERAPGLDPREIDDCVIGCAMPEAQQGLNMARIATIRAGLPYDVPGQTVNRFCSSGLQTIAIAAQQVMAGMGEAIIAGGAESMSMVGMSGNFFSPNPALVEINPEVYMGMGHTAENVAREYNITRDAQDAFAVRSHQRAAAAIDAGKYVSEIVPVDVTATELDSTGRPVSKTARFEVDETVRRETTLDGLRALKPVFAVNGSVTAGNASPLNDGAAAVMVMSAAKAAQLGLKPLVRFVSFAVGGVRPEVMGIGPIAAIPKALRLAGLRLDQIDVIELNEAFAAQALAVMQHLEIDPDRVNVNGGAIALGHPLGCSGAKLTVMLINEMARRKCRYGMVSMCIGGGMGAAGIFENLQ